jgi:hypothetical protein
MRRLLTVVVAFALLGAALPLFATPATAANALQVSVRAGFDGMVRPGTWSPVEVSLANAGPNVNGTVELSVQRRQQAQGGGAISQGVSYSLPVTLPEHSNKRFSTAVFVPPLFDLLSVRVTSGDQTLYRDSFTLQHVDPSQLSCGVLANDQTAFDSLGALLIGDARLQPHLVYLDLPDLPTNPQILGSLDCLIISDYSTRGLSGAQQMALATWVDNGGILTVGTGPSGASTVAGLPPDLLPATVDGTAPLRSLTGLSDYFGATPDPNGPWLAANLKLTDGAPIVSDDSQPILVVARRGKGAVFMVSLSLAQPPLRGWDGTDHIWSYILGYVPIPASVFSSYYRQGYGWGRVPRSVLTQGGGSARPESKLLLLGLLLFGLVIGPINYLVLSRLGRRDLAMVTIPVLAGLSTVGALVYANHYRQGDVEINEVSLVRTFNGSGVGQAHSFVGVFALHPQDYKLQLPDNVLLSGIGFPAQSQLNRPPAPLRLVQSATPLVDGLDLQQGSLSTFALDGQLNQSGKVSGTLNLSSGELSGQVVNGFSTTIRDAWIVAGDSVQSLGDLRPGASHPVSIHLGAPSPVGFGDPGAIVDRLFPGMNHDPGARHDPKYDIMTAALNPGQSYTGQIELSGLDLIGWLSDPPNSVADPVTGQQADQYTLFITSLPFGVSNVQQTIPSQLIEQQQLSSGYSARIESNGISVNAGDTAAFQFTVPIAPAHFAVRSLALNTAADTPVVGTLDVYNWRTQSWDNVPFNLGNTPIPNPERYYSTTGEVRLRFRYKPPSPTSGAGTITFTRFQLGVEGMGR